MIQLTSHVEMVDFPMPWPLETACTARMKSWEYTVEKCEWKKENISVVVGAVPALVRAAAVYFLSVVAASGERLAIRTYTSADGLSSSTVNCVVRDSRGFLWLCTRDGLTRFD